MTPRICGPGLCNCDTADPCREGCGCKSEAGYDGRCEPCHLKHEASCHECGGALAANGKCPDCGFDYTEPADGPSLA